MNPWTAWEARAKDEAYWREHVERGLLKAEYMHDFVLRLWFEQELGVEIYELDFAPIFVKHNPGGIFRALKIKSRFQQVIGNYSLIWLNPVTGEYDEGAIDLAPECVRFFCEQYGKQAKSSNGDGK